MPLLRGATGRRTWGRPHARARTPPRACGWRASSRRCHFLYREIDALNAGSTAGAVMSRLLALRTTPPAALAALSMPVLCIAGEEDVVIPPDAVAILAARAWRTRGWCACPQAGHSVYFERAAAFNRLLDDFLATADGQPVARGGRHASGASGRQAGAARARRA